ncbi:MAG: damage-inducible protein CinA [Planctomycetota bacterium]|nr:MAG: damage-inducible protein CinA [Planctomycetota bacterium]
MNAPTPRFYLLSVGDELLSGDVLDTNAHWIAGELQRRGHRLLAGQTVGDRVGEIDAAVQRVLREVGAEDEPDAWLLITGGLGPTADDLTRDGVAAACGRALRERPELLAALEGSGRRLTAGARRQAELPEGAEVLDNARGTAPGFFLVHEGLGVAVFPGVPGEMRAMVRALLDARAPRGDSQPPRRVLAVGLAESIAGERLGELMDPSRAGCRVGLCVSRGLLTVTVRGEQAEVMDQVADAVAQRLGSHVISRDASLGLAQLVVAELTRRGLTLSCAESCTGGLLAGALTSVPGSSAVFNESFVTYANAAKIERLGVSPALIAEHGVVSEPVAAAMASGCRAATGSDLALAITGIAGPDGGSPDKPVGTVVHALAHADGVELRTLHAGGSRDEVRARSVQLALDMLRRRLQAGGLSAGP